MKNILLTFLLFPMLLLGQDKRHLMKTNFGAEHSVIRFNMSKSYVSRPECNSYGWLGNTESGMLTDVRMSVEALAMVNNNNLGKGEQMSRPRMLGGKMAYDDLRHQFWMGISYYQATTCHINFLGNDVRGFWGLGIVGTTWKEYTITEKESFSDIGARMNFSGYNERFGIYAEANITERPALTFMLSNKFGKRLLLGTGIENNMPKLSWGYMYKRIRTEAQALYFENKIVPGISFIANL